MRLIDADETKNSFANALGGVVGFTFTNAASEILDKQPTVDAVPVVHGRWQAVDEWMTDECSMCGSRINIEDFEECSYHPTEGYVHLNYCPNCGARMDGKEQNGEA